MPWNLEVAETDGPIAPTWRTTHGDLTDEEWELIADSVPSWSGPGQVGRPTKWSKQDVLNATLWQPRAVSGGRCPRPFGIVDTAGLLLAVVVLAASVSDNTGGIGVTDVARTKSARLAKVFCDQGFKKTFLAHCRAQHLSAEMVSRMASHTFEVLPRRWVVERIWSWLMNHRRLQVDYECGPKVTERVRMGCSRPAPAAPVDRVATWLSALGGIPRQAPKFRSRTGTAST